MIRQGELLIKKVSEIKGKRLSHLVIAEGEATGHKHAITKGEAELYEEKGVLYLSCKETCSLTHPDHKTIEIPEGEYEITFQREYVIGDDKYRKVVD